MKRFRTILHFLQIICLLFSLCAFASRFASGGVALWISFFSLAFLPIALVNVLLFVVGCFVASRRWSLLPLVGILLQVGNLLSVWQFPKDVKDRKRGIPLTVVTYNTSHFYWDRQYTLDDAASYLRTLHPDIVCFQEAPNNDYYHAEHLVQAFDFLPYHFTSSRTDHLPMAIYSRYPIRPVKILSYQNSMNSSLVADIQVGSSTVRVISNHLQTTGVNQYLGRVVAPGKSWRVRLSGLKTMFVISLDNFYKRALQADLIHREVASSPYPVIVCGDFNDTPASYAYHRIGMGLTDGFRESGTGYHYTFRQLHRLWRIDYIFYSKEFQGLSYDSPETPFSDHNMVVWKGMLPCSDFP